MTEVANYRAVATAVEKPVQVDDVKFPPFPEPTEEEFEDDIGDAERTFYRERFSDLNTIHSIKLHCTACDRHLGSSTRNESRMRAHPMLRTLVCQTCHTFYNSGEFEKGDDGSELYCRWCGQGGQVYCCSNCPHVFCAKCIKRNLGMPKIREIENTDDWKCFKCNPRSLWDLRAICWALLRYCDLKNKITYKTTDPKLKEAYQKDCSVDHTECCKYKQKRREKGDAKNIKKENESAKKINTPPKLPPAIQVKKFASINVDDFPKEKKPQKRPASPSKSKPYILKNPVPIAQGQKMMSPMVMPPLKKIRMPIMTSPVMSAPIRFNHEKKTVAYPNQASFSRIRPKPPTMSIPIMQTPFNGFPNNTFHNNPNYNNMVVNDNINLSLESLTQGLDMAAVVAMSNNSNNNQDDVVCTPDFPLEPLCEVTEDNTDDDIQCITPGPPAKSAPAPTPKISRVANNLPDISTDNIIQMTDDDVTVNSVTGGLKFRVDPQTLSANKMYRLPDGRIFAINANPTMPGGYSATIVAVTESAGKPTAPKGATYAAKLSAVTTGQTSTPKQTKTPGLNNHKGSVHRTNILRKSLSTPTRTSSSTRETDMHVSVEWYRFNVIEAIDSLEYSLARLEKLKNQATTSYLRQRTVDEMRNLHRTLERVLNTSSTRFNEIRDNLNKEFKQFIIKKTGSTTVSDDDDDVEILPDVNEDPIYIDENSMESTTNECVESQEVDLTGVGSSDHNDSAENIDSFNVDACSSGDKDDNEKHTANDNDGDTANDHARDTVNDHDRDTVRDTTPSKASPDEDNISNSSKTESLQNKIEVKDTLVDPKENNTDEGTAKEDESSLSLDDENLMKSNGSEKSDPTKDMTPDTNDMANTNDKNDEDKTHTDEEMPTEHEECKSESSKESKMEIDGNIEHANDKTSEGGQSENIEHANDKTCEGDQSENIEHANDKTSEGDQSENIEHANDKISEGDQSENGERELIDDVTAKDSENKPQDSEMSEGVIENMLKVDDKLQDPDISEEMIENLLKDDTVDSVDDIDNILNNRAMDVV